MMTDTASGAIGAASFHDTSALSDLRLAAKEDQEGATMAVARQFESIFIQMMLKSMRSAMPEGGLFQSNQMETFQEMFDQQLGVTLAEQQGIGLAEIIARQLSPGGKTVSTDGAAIAYQEQETLKLENNSPINQSEGHGP